MSWVIRPRLISEMKANTNLAGYMDDRLARVEWDIKEKFSRIKGGIETVRKAIPEGAIEEEREHLEHGSQQSLI